MDTLKRFVTGIVLLCALLTLSFWIGSMYMQQVNKTYTYKASSFSFEYKPQFKVEEKDHLEGFKTLTLVPVIHTTPVLGGEEEPRIQCALFANGKNKKVSSWVKSQEYTHIMGQLVQDTTYPSVDIPDIEAVGFKTNGLYVSDHVAFVHAGQFIDCSVEYITLDDPLRMNFVAFVGNIKLSSEE